MTPRPRCETCGRPAEYRLCTEDGPMECPECFRSGGAREDMALPASFAVGFDSPDVLDAS